MERPIRVLVRMWVLAISAAPEWVIGSSIALEPNPKPASWAVPTWFTTKVWTDDVRIRLSVADGQSVAKIVDKALVLLCSPARGNSSSAFVQALAKDIILGIHHWTLYIQRQSRMTANSNLDYNQDDHTIPMLTIPRGSCYRRYTGTKYTLPSYGESAVCLIFVCSYGCWRIRLPRLANAASNSFFLRTLWTTTRICEARHGTQWLLWRSLKRQLETLELESLENQGAKESHSRCK